MTTESPLATLAARLTDPQDRNSYASLLLYFNALPVDDEMFRLARLLGFLTLIGQRIPEAASELLCELKAESAIAHSCYELFDERLSSMNKEIATGIDIDGIAKAMTEAVRQAAGKELGDVRKLAGEVGGDLKLLSRSVREATVELTAERAKMLQTTLDLQAASAALQKADGRLKATSLAWAFASGMLALFALLVVAAVFMR